MVMIEADGIDFMEVELCLELARLWDDPENNNFDYPFEWKRVSEEEETPEDE